MVRCFRSFRLGLILAISVGNVPHSEGASKSQNKAVVDVRFWPAPTLREVQLWETLYENPELQSWPLVGSVFVEPLLLYKKEFCNCKALRVLG